MTLVAWTACAQTAKVRPAAAGNSANSSVRPTLVVVIVVDQMRADYVDKFRNQWSGGLKRLVDEGAWFRSAAYPLCHNANLRRPFHHFDRGLSLAPWDGGQRLVGSRSAENGHLHE
jgi:hypothetical protein